MDELLEKIKELLDKNCGCMCAWYERCELCDPNSAYNRLREKIREVAFGPLPQVTLNDYGKTITISRTDIEYKF